MSAAFATHSGNGGTSSHASFVYSHFTAVAESKHHVSERYIYRSNWNKIYHRRVEHPWKLLIEMCAVGSARAMSVYRAKRYGLVLNALQMEGNHALSRSALKLRITFAWETLAFSGTGAPQRFHLPFTTPREQPACVTHPQPSATLATDLFPICCGLTVHRTTHTQSEGPHPPADLARPEPSLIAGRRCAPSPTSFIACLRTGCIVS